MFEHYIYGGGDKPRKRDFLRESLQRYFSPASSELGEWRSTESDGYCDEWENYDTEE